MAVYSEIYQTIVFRKVDSSPVGEKHCNLLDYTFRKQGGIIKR